VAFFVILAPDTKLLMMSSCHPPTIGELTMKQHVNRVASTCFFHLYHLRQLKRYVTLHTMKHLVSALILSRLDYCNSALAGLTWSTTRVDPRGSDQMHAFSVNNPLLKGPQPTTNISTRSII